MYGFKIGDKVKMVEGLSFSMGKKIGTVVGFRPISENNDWDYYILVIYGKFDKEQDFPFKQGEIVKAVQPGQQLLFPFMEE